MQKKVPNLYIVGAGKSGTTALASILTCFDDVYLSKYKEPHFHIPDHYKKQLSYAFEEKEDYLSLYENASEKYLLDASMCYLPLYEYSISSIKGMCPDAKIIIILRDPLQRALSAYKHCLRFDAKEKLDFNSAVSMDKDRRHGDPMRCYVWLSDYKSQVEAYCNEFDDVLIIRSSDLENHQGDVLETVAKFLKIQSFSVDRAMNVNSEVFSWRSRTVGMIVNSILSGRSRFWLRRKFPLFYRFIKKFIILVATRKSKQNVNVSKSTQDLFVPLQEAMEDLFEGIESESS